jgi:hypothetical protein
VYGAHVGLAVSIASYLPYASPSLADYINKKNPSTINVEGSIFKKVITYTCLINDIACRGLWCYVSMIQK